MKKQFTILSILIFVLSPLAGLTKIDDSHTKSVAQILIWDMRNQKYISSGSGINLSITSSTFILTNYHVVEDIIRYPDLYKAIVCVTEKSQSTPKCDYMASAYHAYGGWPGKAKYSEELDLALIAVNWKREDDNSTKWKSIAEMPMNEWPSFGGVISSVPYGYELTGIELGDEVQTLGFPDYGYDTMTYSNGVVSNFWMDDGTIFENHDGVLAIGTSAKIAPGSSGGAAFNKDGEFLGITSAGIMDDNGNFMTGVIIPVTTVNWWLKSLGYLMDKDGEDAVLREKERIFSEEVYCCYLDTYDKNGKTRYDAIKDECVCEEGYTTLETSDKCITYSDSCKKSYGQNSYYIGKMTDENETICGCLSGYIWKGTECKSIEEKREICKLNTVYFPAYPETKSDAKRMYGPRGEKEKGCKCPDGYVWQDDMCVTDKNISNNNYDKNCKSYYGENSYFTGNFNDEGQSLCGCRSGYVWNKLGDSCISNIVEEEKFLITEVDNNLSKRVSGNILLQVEKNGEGWYVYPDNKKKYYLGRPADAFNVMRKLG
ncbi:MAG: serine protease, partial [Patescibacteria group bacterium]|nr:serine protease [Patescibacteria group bacterium]